MTRTARQNGDNARSTKTLPASSWEDLKPRSVFKFGAEDDVVKKGVNDKRLRSEQRRMRRVVQRVQAKSCFHCRSHGHVVANCPKMKNDTDHASGICFKCGSTEHSMTNCRAKVPDGQLPFAKCFICGETGHLSKSCADNPRGLYPMGGGCDICGSVEHLKKDCPEAKFHKSNVEDITLWTMDSLTNVEEDLAFLPPEKPKEQKKTVKVVKF